MLQGERIATFPRRSALAADLIHGAFGTMKLGAADPMGGRLGGDAVPNQAAQLVIGSAAAQELPGIPFDGREEAIANLALGGQPQAIAIAAEGFAHRIDEADGAATVGEPEIDGGLARVCT